MEYPRMVPGIILVSSQDGYVVEGGPSRDLFTGPVVLDLVPRLLPLLDGARAVAEIAAVLGRPADEIAAVVRALARSGVVEVLDAPPGIVDDPPSPLRGYLRRSIPGGRGEIIYRRLQAASALVTGEGQIPDRIADLLARSGVGAVARRSASAGWGAGNGASPDLVIEVVRADQDHGQVANGAAAPPLLPVRLGDPEITVGPLVDVPGGRCRGCCMAAGSTHAGIVADPDRATASAVAGVAAGAALRYLGGYGTTWIWSAAIAVRTDNGQQRQQPVPRRPGCAACGRPGLRLSGTALTEFDDDQAAETAPRGGDIEPLSLGSPTGPARRHLTEPRLDPRKPYCDLIPGGEPGNRAWPTLSWVLERAVGAPRNPNRPAAPTSGRWAPSVGNLGPLQAYVVHLLPGAAAQAWYYDAAAHDFVAVRQSTWSGIPGPGLAGKSALSLVLVGDIAYCTSRLGRTGRRVVHQDAGAAVAQLHWCCRAAGWSAAARADEERGKIMAALDLDPGREAITAVIDVALPPEPRPAVATSPRNAMRRASSILRQSSMTYAFGPAPVPATLVEEAVRRSLARTADVWPQAGPQVGCVLYARRVAGLPPGYYDVATRQPLPGPDPGELCPVLETYLGDRRLDPPVLALFCGDRETALSAYGADGHATLIAKSAAAASFTRLLCTAGGLSSGIFARLPSALLDAAAGRLRVGSQVYCGLAVGPGSGSSPDMDVIW
jgi:hypothetical protein